MLHPAAIVGICIGGYVVLAILAVQLLPPAYSEAAKRRKAKVKFATKRVAHRGGSLNGPENTLWTFRRTEGETDVLELDVALTSDGMVVVTHDTELSRQCGRSGRIDELSSAALPLLAPDVPLHFPSASNEAYHLCRDERKAKEFGLCTEPQPYCLLEEVFSSFPRLPIHLDIKYPSADLVTKVLDLIDRFERRRLTIVGSAGTENCSELRRQITARERQSRKEAKASGQDPELFITFASFREVLTTYVLFYLGLLPVAPLPFDCFSIPLITNSKRSMFAARNFGNCCVRAIASSLLTAPSLWRHLRRRGIIVLGFVLNDPDEWDEVRDWPIDGIMTDDVLKLSRHFGHCRDKGVCSCPAGHDSIPPAQSSRAKVGSPLGTPSYGATEGFTRQKTE